MELEPVMMNLGQFLKFKRMFMAFKITLFYWNSFHAVVLLYQEMLVTRVEAKPVAFFFWTNP